VYPVRQAILRQSLHLIAGVSVFSLWVAKLKSKNFLWGPTAQFLLGNGRTGVVSPLSSLAPHCINTSGGSQWELNTATLLKLQRGRD